MFSLPQLPYAYDALEPHIDAKTMEIHHTKHHQAYIDKLNTALESHTDLQQKSLEELLRSIDSLPEDIKMAIRNHGGGHANHSLFWQLMSTGQPAMSEKWQSQLTTSFGSIDSFKEQFTQAAANRFGSGWAWLIVTADKSLAIISTANQDSPLMENNVPVLGLDVWEHAYYLKYQNKRPDYITAWWNVVNWPEVENQYNLAISN